MEFSEPTTTSISRDQLHGFTVRDQDDDNWYSFHLDTNLYGPDRFASIAAASAFPFLTAERSCTSDSLWSQYRSVDKMGTGGNWINWFLLYNDYTTHASPYRYCAISNTSTT
jgi:hypothetical protein